MIRLVIYLLVLAAAAFGVAWLADRPGVVTIDWQGWQVETSILVAASALLVLLALAIALWTLLRFILRSPDIVAFSWRNRKRNRGWAAVSRGLVAVGSGDVMGARRAANDAQRLLGSEPLTQLLAAQAAQLAGDAEGAKDAFRSMSETPSTRLLGLRGLHVEARRRGDSEAALLAAEEAARHEPGLVWAADAVIESRCLNGDYDGALIILEREVAHGGLDRATHRRRRAVLLAAQAQALELADPAIAREKAVEAVRLAPTLVPAAEVAGRLLGAAGDTRKAAKIIEAAYTQTPHPDLADAFLHLRPGDSSRERLKRIRNLISRAPEHPESAMVLARAAIDAQDFDVARTALGPLLAQPTQRVCLLMAELEAGEHADIGKAREWTARAVRAQRDPAWVADGVVAERWGPVSPITGRLDSFEWTLPPGLATTPMLDHEAERVKAAIAAAIEARPSADPDALVTAVPVEIVEPAKPETVIQAEPAPVVLDVVPQAADTKRDDAEKVKPVSEAATALAPDIVEPKPRPKPEPEVARRTPGAAGVSEVVAMPHMPDDPGPGPYPDEPAGVTRPPYGV